MKYFAVKFSSILAHFFPGQEEIPLTKEMRSGAMSDEVNVCMRCRGEVHPEALACSNCGATFTNTDEYQRQRNAEGEGALWGIVTVVVLIAGALLFGWFD